MKNASLKVVVAAMLLSSCKKVVSLTLNNAPAAAIVIQGEVTNQPGPYFVTISRPVDFYADNNFPPVSGATVLIAGEGTGITDTLTEITPGTYSTHQLQGIPESTYHLSVTVAGVNYNAFSTMPAVVNLDSLTFVSNSGFGRKRISAVANFNDPPGVKNYYQFIEYLNGARLTKDLFVFDDRLSDGRYIRYTLFNDSSYLQPGDQVAVDLQGLDSAVFNYFLQLFTSGGVGSFNTSASPANPTSNISNGAYGYFSAHTVSSRSAYVP